MGILILAAAGLYLLLSLAVVLFSIFFAKKYGKNAQFWGGCGAALVMYLIPFWDWLPTVAVHQYYCATQSGLWVYKTLDQWKIENPKARLHSKRSIQATSDGERYILDERFFIETHREKPISALTTIISDRLLIDSKTMEIMAKEVTVGSGHGNPATVGGYKFWLSLKPCRIGGISDLIREIENIRSDE
jgi:hypothetical protein